MKDSGSREPLHFLLFSTSLLSKPNEDPAAFDGSGVFICFRFDYVDSRSRMHGDVQ